METWVLHTKKKNIEEKQDAKICTKSIGLLQRKQRHFRLFASKKRGRYFLPLWKLATNQFLMLVIPKKKGQLTMTNLVFRISI
jgi:hypothetical protein